MLCYFKVMFGITWGHRVSSSAKLIELCKGNKTRDEVPAMVLSVASLLLLPGQLERYGQLIRDRMDFLVDDAWRDICYKHKSIANSSGKIIENIIRSFEAIRLVNVVIIRLLLYKDEQFDPANQYHSYLLTELWNSLKPDRTHDFGFISQEWMELGFQGPDPSTDFRSMGILSLMQLVHFSKNRNQAARMILSKFTENSSKYFPFAVIGVNITRFILDLVDEFRIHRILLQNLGHTVSGDLNNYEVAPSDDLVCIEFGLTVIHDFYCVVFEEFYLQWVVTNPENVMLFSSIFDQVKEKIRRNYCSLLS